ncbi:hypothetical protein EHP00_1494 [Ecytonucleospora hepatopenaei]|uniref:Uncharacterized protein n=1 Tax=Ecytonucleospora hepatopenaei TaxID=646526 RepID=A0A1W0E8R0_9MICR|nr:hypothetical protein EHP00_1494 [Ecytonucleospora hepatopenaei]
MFTSSKNNKNNKNTTDIFSKNMTSTESYKHVWKKIDMEIEQQYIDSHKPLVYKSKISKESAKALHSKVQDVVEHAMKYINSINSKAKRRYKIRQVDERI